MTTYLVFSFKQCKTNNMTSLNVMSFSSSPNVVVFFSGGATLRRLLSYNRPIRRTHQRRKKNSFEI